MVIETEWTEISGREMGVTHSSGMFLILVEHQGALLVDQYTVELLPRSTSSIRQFTGRVANKAIISMPLLFLISRTMDRNNQTLLYRDVNAK